MLDDLEAAIGSVPYLRELILTLVTWVVALIVIRYNGRWLGRVRDEVETDSLDDRSIKRLDQFIDLLVVVVAIFISLSIWGIDEMIYAALTTIGVIGVMLGFAVKDVASNFISGILLIMSKDLLIGDAIAVNGIEGEIEAINIRTTSVRRWDGALALVPNSMLLNNPVVDFSATERRRVELPLVISSQEDLPRAVEALEELARGDQRTLGEEEVTVLVRDMADSRVTLELRYWVKRADLITAKSDMHTAIHRAFGERGISLDVSTSVELVGGAGTERER